MSGMAATSTHPATQMNQLTASPYQRYRQAIAE
jgi:hypothetical protein